MQERANHELKRRSRVAWAFLSMKSLIRMLGAVSLELDEDQAARRWFTEESVAMATSRAETTAPPPSYGGGAGGGNVGRIIDVAVADNPVGRRAA